MDSTSFLKSLMIRLLALHLCASLFCLAQTKTSVSSTGNASAQSFVLAKIQANGSTRFSEADIVRATSLKPGATVTGDELKQAASRLAECGVFKDVRFTFDGKSATYAVLDL